MHRPLLSSQNLDEILCLQYTRILSRQLTISYGNRIYQIQTERPAYALRHAPVTVKEDLQGNVRIVYKEQSLAYMVLKEQPKATIVDSKQLNDAVDRISRQLGIGITITETALMPQRYQTAN